MKFLRILTIAGIVAIFIFSMRIPTVAQQPATLIMFHNPECQYCQKFMDEVCLTKEEEEIRNTQCPGYGWKQDPKFEKYLMLVVTKDRTPDWVAKAFDDGDIRTVKYTPTFVLWNGREIGRIVGYESKEAFYEELEELIKQDRPKKTFYRVGKREATW